LNKLKACSNFVDVLFLGRCIFICMFRS